MIVRRSGISPDFGLHEFRDIAAILDRWRYLLSPLWLIGAFSARRHRIGRD
jgi:hypothetical protein